MKILFVGDVVGKPGRVAVERLVPVMRKECGLDFVVANAENSSGGSGITSETAGELFNASVDVLTSGDHIWKRKEIFELIRFERKIIRPVNYPAGAPGCGYGIFQAPGGIKVGVINALGRVFLEPLECPFRTVKNAVEQIRKETPIILVDIHAEATSEKIALGWYLDGSVSAVVGTHTHVQTADERVLPKGTAYITDAGMVGPFDSVLGRRVEDVLQRFLTSLPIRFEVANENIQMHGVILDIDEQTGRARSITRIQKKI